MTLPIQYNPINLDNLQIEFGGNDPISLSEYYGYGNAPASGTISLGNFHQTAGTSNPVTSDLLFELDARNASSWPGSGTIWYDTTANARNFNLVNGPTGGTNSVSFDGTNDYMEISDGTWIPEGTSAKTFECYVNMHSWRTGQYAFLTSKTSPSNQSWSFGLFESSGVVKLVLNTQGGGNFSASTDFYTLPTPSNYLNSYHQYAFTYDGSVAKMYIDGSLVFTSASGKAFHSNTAPMRLMVFDPSNASFTWPVDGEMRGVRMYNRALSAAEVSTNYSSWSGPITPVAATLSFTPTSHSGSTFTGTFNFTQNVGRFETGDISVSGGSKGTFTKVSSSEYTLAITPSPTTGNVSVSVPTNSAYTAANLGHNSISQTVSYSSYPSDLYMRLNANDSTSYGGSGTTWFDTTTNNLDFALQNGPVFNSTSPKHFDFDGSNDVAYNGTFTVPSSTEATWIIWFRMDSATQPSFSALFGIRYGTGGTNIIGFKNNNEFQYHWNDNYWNTTITGLSPAVNTWYMICLRINSTSGRFDLKYGTTTNTFTNTASHGTFSHSNSTAYVAQDPESTARIFNGDISDIAIWRRRLSDAEVDSVYASTKGIYGY